jgi:group I intron endonuclease
MKASLGSIYLITNLINGKLYVGQTVYTVELRFSKHVRTANLGSELALCRAIRKYGAENFKIETIEVTFETELDNREIFWIKELNSLCFGGGLGYNMTTGGHGVRGRIQSEEEKKKRVLSCTGKTHTAETKALMSQKMTGREITWADKVSEGMKKRLADNPDHMAKVVEQALAAAIKNKKPVEALMNGVWVEFAGTEDLAQAIGAKAPNITNVIRGKADTIKGFSIRSKDPAIQALCEKNRLERKSKPGSHKRVICLETKEIFDSRRAVAAIFNVSMRAVDDSVNKNYACRTKEHGKLHFAEMI